MIKKIISAIMVTAMVATLFIPAVSAWDERMFINVFKVGESQITVDGNVTAGEWDENNKIVLSMKEGSTPALTSCVGKAEDFLDIEFYYCWSDVGIYLAAKVNDDNLSFEKDATTATIAGDHFQISFNPAGIIDDQYEGMFFSFIPVAMAEGETVGEIKATRHNITGGRGAEDDEITLITEDEDFQAKYTKTTNGWQLEAILPWKYIAAASRTYELDYEDDNTNNNILLTNFTPNDTNRKRAYADMLLTYVDYDEGAIKAAAGTFIDGSTNWHVDNYGLRLKFRNADEMYATDTDVQTWKRTDKGVKLNPIGLVGGSNYIDDITDAPEDTDGYWNRWDITDEVTDAPDYWWNEPVTVAETDPDTDRYRYDSEYESNEAETKKPRTTRSKRDDDEDETEDDDDNVRTIIITAVVAVVATIAIGATVIIVVLKKKKQ